MCRTVPRTTALHMPHHISKMATFPQHRLTRFKHHVITSFMHKRAHKEQETNSILTFEMQLQQRRTLLRLMFMSSAVIISINTLKARSTNNKLCSSKMPHVLQRLCDGNLCHLGIAFTKNVCSNDMQLQKHTEMWHLMSQTCKCLLVVWLCDRWSDRLLSVGV